MQGCRVLHWMAAQTGLPLAYWLPTMTKIIEDLDVFQLGNKMGPLPPFSEGMERIFEVVRQISTGPVIPAKVECIHAVPRGGQAVPIRAWSGKSPQVQLSQQRLIGG